MHKVSVQTAQWIKDQVDVICNHKTFTQALVCSLGELNDQSKMATMDEGQSGCCKLFNEIVRLLNECEGFYEFRIRALSQYGLLSLDEAVKDCLVLDAEKQALKHSLDIQRQKLEKVPAWARRMFGAL